MEEKTTESSVEEDHSEGKPKEEVKTKYRTFFIEVNEQMFDVRRVIQSLGCRVVLTSDAPGSHPMSNALRAVMRRHQVTHKVMKVIDVLVVLDPAFDEAKVFQKLLRDHKRENGKGLGLHVVSRRTAQLGGADAAEVRQIHDAPLPVHRAAVLTAAGRDVKKPLSKAMKAKFAYGVVANDCFYWYSIESAFVHHGFKDYPGFDKYGLHVLVTLFDFRSTDPDGFSLWLPRYQAPAVPAREHVRDDVVFRTHKQDAVDFTENYAVREGGVITHYTVGDKSGAVEASYSHPFLCADFFEYSMKTFIVDGESFTASLHVEASYYGKTLINVKYYRSNPGDRDQKKIVPTAALIDGGFVPALFQRIRPRSKFYDEETASSLKAWWQLVESTMADVLPATFRSKLAFWEKQISAAVENTGHHALYDALISQIPVGTRGKNLKHIAQAARVNRAAEKWGVSPEVAGSIVRLQTDSTKVEFFLELCSAAKQLFFTGVEKLKEFFDWIRQSRSEEFVAVELDIVALLRRLLRVSPPLKKAGAWIDQRMGQWGWLKNQRNSFMSLSKTHPLFANAMLVLVEATMSFIRVLAEESFKRLASPLFLVLSGLEIICDLVDWYFAKDIFSVSISRVLRDAVIRTVVHGLLTLCPFPIAVILHWLWNVFHGKGLGFFQDLHEALERENRRQQFEEANLEMSDFSQVEGEHLSEKLLVKTAVGLVPLVNEPHLIEMAKRQVVRSDNTIMLMSDAARLIAKPTGRLLEVACFIHARMDMPLPYEPVDARVREGYQFARKLYLKDKMDVVAPWSEEVFMEYLKGQKFPQAKLQSYIDKMNSLEELRTASKPISFFGKTDEKLAKNPMFPGAQGTVKGRPVFPLVAEQINMMRFLLPFKKRFEEPIEIEYRGRVHTVTYVVDGKASRLDEWINRRSWEDGVHAIVLGDDCYILYVDHKTGKVGPNAIAFAYDLAKCDRTCQEQFQKCFGDYLTSCGMDLLTYANFIRSCTGLRKVDIKGTKDISPDGQDLEFYWQQEYYSTITGNPATSLQAYFAQLCFLGRAWVEWVDDGRWDLDVLIDKINWSGTQNGHILEWEIIQKKVGVVTQMRRYGDPRHLSFLGGYFSHNGLRFSWFSYNFLKALTVFPDTTKIYAGNHVAMHCAAVSQDLMLTRTPLGRAFRDMFVRIACNADLTKEDFRDAVAQYEVSRNWFVRKQMKDKHLSAEAIIGDGEWNDWLSSYADAKGFSSAVEANMLVIEELQSIVSLPAVLHTPCVDLFYLPRFGPPKVNLDKVWSLPRLDLLPSLFQSGERVLSALSDYFLMSQKNSKKASKETKEVKKEVQKVERKLDKMDKEVREPKKARSRANGKIDAQKRELAGSLRNLPPDSASTLRNLARRGEASYVEKKNFQYLRGLANPWLRGMPGSPHGRPPHVETQTWQVPFQQTMQANTSGFCWAGVFADGWLPNTVGGSGGPADMLIPHAGCRKVCTSTNGHIMCGTTNTFVGTTIPTPATTINPVPAGMWSQVPGGPGASSNLVMPGSNLANLGCRVRMNSLELQITPVSSKLVTQGVVYAYRRIQNANVSVGAIVEGTTGAALVVSTPDKFELQTQALAEWPEGKWMRIALIPNSHVATKMWNMLADAAVVVGYSDAGFICTGCANDQTFRLRLVVNWETTRIPSYLSTDFHSAVPIEFSDSSAVDPGVLAMRPGVLTGMVRDEQKPNERAPLQAMVDHKVLTEGPPEDNWVSSLTSGLVKAAPYVESAVSLIASLL